MVDVSNELGAKIAWYVEDITREAGFDTKFAVEGADVVVDLA